MNNEDLKNSLNSLHATLKSTEKADPDLLALLQVLDDDIRQLIARDARDAAGASGLADRTQSIAAQFAAQHPKIEIVLRELADALGKMGI